MQIDQLILMKIVTGDHLQAHLWCGIENFQKLKILKQPPQQTTACHQTQYLWALLMDQEKSE